MADLSEWMMDSLSSLLQFPVTEDMVRCILMIESSRDLEDYMKTLVDYSNPTHQNFVQELLKKKALSNVSGYRKSEVESIEPLEKKERKKTKGKNDNKKPAQQDEQGKKKTKYVNLYAADDVILLKGRHLCNCQASKHALINNCLKCGRIVCEQEGTGPCLFCSNLVRPRGERGSSTGQFQMEPSLSSALQLKDRLLEYDKASEVRTKVIDDESDYFSTNSVWLSKAAREELKKKEEELQELKHSRARNLILDFTGRCLIDDEFKKLNLESSLLEDVTDILHQNSASHYENDDFDPKSTLEIEPIYEGGGGGSRVSGSRWTGSSGRVQDKQVLEMADCGACLSMHQPWASLLMHGIKRDEGRSWYTSHRGRLWIASTAKVPSKEEIEEVLNVYRHFRGVYVELPKKYPSGCLLGCVTLTDCLPQEEYRQLYPEGESEEPYVFICSNPIQSPILFPIKGKHKIYNLEKNIHQAAVKCLQKLGKL